MRRIDSAALAWAGRALGLAGRGASETEFLDSLVYQTLEVAQLVRRGLTQAGTSGLYYPLIRNVHVGASTIVTNLNPFNLGVGVIAPYPNPVPVSFDLWLLAATVRMQAGSGTLSAALFVDYTNQHQGWGVDNASAAVVSVEPRPVARWDSTNTDTHVYGTDPRGLPRVRIGMRLPRQTLADGTQLIFSTTSSAAATFDCQLDLALFPVGLGQDALC